MDGFVMLFIKRNKIFAWIPALGWMILIFYLSHQPATSSSELSAGITAFIINMIEKMIPFIEVEISSFHTFIRKCAHFLAYLILGILVAYAIHVKRFYRFVFALIICVLYAISDEVHQLFIPGRSGEVGDVLIDSVGSFSGIVIFVLFDKWRNGSNFPDK